MAIQELSKKEVSEVSGGGVYTLLGATLRVPFVATLLNGVSRFVVRLLNL